MKRFLPLVFIIVILFAGYWSNNKYNEKRQPMQPLICATKITELLSKDPSTLDPVELSLVLKDCGYLICKDENLLKKVAAFHTFADTVASNNALKKYWSKLSNVKYAPLTFSEIEALSGADCYENYLTSVLDTSKTMNEFRLTKTPNFTTKPRCFSIPLFKSIRLNDTGIVGSTKIYFTKVGDPNNPSLAFYVDNKASVVLYDFTDRPLNENPLYRMIQLIKSII